MANGIAILGTGLGRTLRIMEEFIVEIKVKDKIIIIDDGNSDISIRRVVNNGIHQPHYRVDAYDPVTKKCGHLDRLVMERKLGKPIPEGMIVDHIDFNGCNNIIDNLRVCTHAENAHHRRVPKIIEKSGRGKGYSWNKVDKRWYASITLDYKRIYLGSFEVEEVAACVYDYAAWKYHGKFASYNVDFWPNLYDTIVEMGLTDVVVAAMDRIESGKFGWLNRSGLSSYYPGVSFDKARNKWEAYSKMVNGKHRHLGRFDTEEEAHQAVLSGERKPRKPRDRSRMSSRYEGVTLDKSRNKWLAYKYINHGKRKSLGFFNTEEGAHQARVNYDNIMATA